tara:strand:- start:1340 stop:1648 length:309 start_codon:yes stop_codon:yes gene_type:complete
MAIYDYLRVPDGVKTYLRIVSTTSGLTGAYLIHQAQAAGQMGDGANALKVILAGIGISGAISTMNLGRNAVDRIRSNSLDDKVEKDPVDDNGDRDSDIRRAA